MKKFFVVALCLCLTACGTFNVNVKVVQPTVQVLPTATSTTAPNTPTATTVTLPMATRQPDQPFMLVNIQMTDPSYGWGVDTLGRIVRTSNSGSVWVNVTPSEEAFDLHSLFAFSDKVAWVASSTQQNSHLIWHTLDGGVSWKASQPIPLGAGSYTP